MFFTTMRTNTNKATVITVMAFARVLSLLFFSIALAPTKATAMESTSAASAVKDIDFKDIQFWSYNLTRINIHNLIVDFSHQKTHKFVKYIKSYMSTDLDIYFYMCNITDTVIINDADNI